MTEVSPATGPAWDVFISYASEDREVFVRPLCDALAARGVKVWVDYGEITLGDSLRRSIDHGLASSRFAVAVLSPSSLDKFWTRQEIDGLFAIEGAIGTKRILPVLHGLTHTQLAAKSPLLAGRLAGSSHDLNAVVAAITRVVQATPMVRSGVVATKTYNVPQRLPSFVGRTPDFAHVEAALAHKQVAVSAAISGLAGIGKTALATELAHRLAAEGKFPGGIYWLSAENPDLSLVWPMADLGGRIAPDVDPKERGAEALRRLSAAHADLLVILDNVESWDAGHRPQPLPEGEHVHVLVTTRERNLGGSQLAQVELGVLLPDDARTLLLDTAARDIEPGVDDLLRHLDGHALAIELAGAYLREFVEASARDYLASLAADASVEARVPSGRTRYERTTQQALDALWRRVDLDTQRAWCLAGAFADEPVPFELSNLCGLDEGARAKLRRFHLVEISTTTKHWHAHRLVLGYARTRTPDDLRRDVEDAFFSGCAKLAKTFHLSTGYKPYLAARPHIDRAVSMHGREPTVFSAFMDRVGVALCSAGFFTPARSHLEAALEADLKYLGPDHTTVATRRSNLGIVLRDLGELSAAKQQHELALEANRKQLAADHPHIAVCRSNLGSVLRELGELTAARQQLELALETYLKKLGPDHPNVAIVRSNLGVVLQELGDLSAARHQLELSLDVDQKILGSDHPDVAIRRSNLGMVLKDLGELMAAKEQLELALHSDLTNLGPDHPSVAIRRANLGTVFEKLSDLPAATREGREALRIARRQPSASRVRIKVERLWAHLDT